MKKRSGAMGEYLVLVLGIMNFVLWMKGATSGAYGPLATMGFGLLTAILLAVGVSRL